MIRREFITVSTALALSFGVGSSAAQSPAPPAAPLTFRTKPHKALIARPTSDDLKRIKEAGFEGVESRSDVTPEDAAKMRVAADNLGMRIHSGLIDHWGEFNIPDQT